MVCTTKRPSVYRRRSGEISYLHFVKTATIPMVPYVTTLNFHDISNVHVQVRNWRYEISPLRRRYMALPLIVVMTNVLMSVQELKKALLRLKTLRSMKLKQLACVPMTWTGLQSMTRIQMSRALCISITTSILRTTNSRIPVSRCSSTPSGAVHHLPLIYARRRQCEGALAADGPPAQPTADGCDPPKEETEEFAHPEMYFGPDSTFTLPSPNGPTSPYRPTVPSPEKLPAIPLPPPTTDGSDSW
ncbi:unnamed protein product, partial [Nesidiocoris tenuis]